MKTKIKITVILFLLTITELKPQAIYDTLYSFPDTTTFYNTGITIVDDIANIAVKFNVDSTWDYYQIEKIIFTMPDGIDTTSYSYLCFSIGLLPEDSVLYYRQVLHQNLELFPANNVLVLYEPLLINNKNSFYLSGSFFYFLSISQYFNEGIAGQYAYWYSIHEWIEL